MKRPRSVEILAAGETLRPAASGDKRRWPTSQSPFYVRDSNSHTRFLVDTGSEVSVIPPSLLNVAVLQLHLH